MTMTPRRQTLAFVVPTKDRPKEVAELLSSLNGQTRRPDLIVLVDGSRRPVADIVTSFGDLNIRYEHVHPPSAARQRNVGLRSVNPAISLVGFLDDDIVFEPHSLERMLSFWETAPKEVGGAAFNQMNHPPLTAGWFKRLPLAAKLGIYSTDRGRVLDSGFHIQWGVVTETLYGQWLPGGASVWSADVLRRHRFDEWFRGYSYLEDLDFSYRIGKTHKLAVVADAPYYHNPSPTSRLRGLPFGKKEVLNRLYFVKKYPEFSVRRCYAALALRMALSLALLVSERRLRFGARVLGNLAGFTESLILKDA